MITMSVATLLTILGMCGALLAFAVGTVWQAGVKLGKFGEILERLSKAVDRLADLGERVLVIETKLGIKGKSSDD